MSRKTWRLIIVVHFLAISWAASAWTLPEEAHDIADELGALRQAVPHHPFEERDLLGKEVEVTLPQLRDRLDDVQERLRHEPGTYSNQTFEIIATVQWELRDLETRVHGIGLVQEEAAYLVMREEMRQGLEQIDQRMNAVVTAIRRSENVNFAH